MSDELSSIAPSDGAPPADRLSGRISVLWHRIRAGEEPIAFGAVAVAVVVAAGLLWFWVGARSGGVPAASAAPGANSAGSRPAEPASTTTPPVAVHVAGAVSRPGLYRLPTGSRVADALALAGGKLPRADLDRLNLAAKLVDGQKVMVTRRGESLPVETGAAGSDGAPTGGDPEPVDLNAADLAALDSLPGIGPATARAIIEERTRRGGFRSPRDLLRVPGIGEGRFARLKDRVRV